MREIGKLASLFLFTCLGGTQWALGTLQVGGSQRMDDRDVDENAAVRERRRCQDARERGRCGRVRIELGHDHG